ncbi:MAG: glycoside hydrolase family 13 protein [Actinomycetota bacterium]
MSTSSVGNTSADSKTDSDENEVTSRPLWWKEAIFYQIYPRSFADSNGDGEGDLKGITEHLKHVSDLGADAIWLSPFYTSPNKDGGYDVADPRGVDPRHGTLEDAKDLFARAKELNLKVLVDVVPNHFSSAHPWFIEALNSQKNSAARARFHFYDGRTATTPPNNWSSLFGGPAWTQVEDGQWYLHLFDSSQPDLNWDNPEVHIDFEKTLRFWLDLGVDGFRIDVAHGLAKENILQDHYDPQGLSNALRLDVEMSAEKRSEYLSSVPFFDLDGVHDIYREWRKLFDSYNKDVMAVAEAWVHPPERAIRYVRHDELQQVFNFDLLVAPFDDTELFDCIDRTLKLIGSIGASPTWALSNHDTPRVASRIGAVEARALALFTFGLPGACYIFQGQELGLPDAELADKDRQDPAFFRTNGAQKGRDGARVPMPWSGSAPPFGFSSSKSTHEFNDSSEKTWLPMPKDWQEFTVENETGDVASSLEMYRKVLALRKFLAPGIEAFTWTRTPDPILDGTFNEKTGVISFRRGAIEVVLNTSDQPRKISLSDDVTGHLLISSDSKVENYLASIETSSPASNLLTISRTFEKSNEFLLAPFTCIWIGY